MTPAGLRRFAWFTAGATWLLVMVGSLVTSTGSGDAVPDWWFLPISYGSLLPPMVGGIFYEHGHRLVAFAVGLLTLALAVWMQRRGPRRLRRLAWIAVAAVAAQGILGGIRVLVFHGNPAAASILHATIAQAFFAWMVAIAVLASKGPDPLGAAGAGGSGAGEKSAGGNPAGGSGAGEGAAEQHVRAGRTLRRAAALAMAAVFVQIVLGTVLRHTLDRTALWIHAGAVLVVLHLTARAVFLAFVHPAREWLRGPARAVLGCLAVQVVLGLFAFALAMGGLERSIQTSWGTLAVLTGHVGVAALLLGSTVALVIRARQVDACSVSPSPRRAVQGAPAPAPATSGEPS